MEKIQIAIIGGGASGLMLANALAENVYDNPTAVKTVVFERGERVGKKLSATGNGQGNISNRNAVETENGYFTLDESAKGLAYAILKEYPYTAAEQFWLRRGVALACDERGRAYPSGRQASALTDALRFYAAGKGIELRTGALVKAIEKEGNGFVIRYEKEGSTHTCHAEKVVLCTGGKAAKNFGTDGSAYDLAKRFGHTVTALYPSLVQLKTDTAYTKTLKGIRIADGGLLARAPSGEYALQGDIIFTDYGVSGDAVFRISAFITSEIPTGKVSLSIDFLPNTTEEEVLRLLQRKKEIYPDLDKNELLFGIVNNQVGRAVLRRANGDLRIAAKLIKDFPLTVTGNLGFDYAQVTKGGIPLSETDENLQSRLVKGLYFAGETLDVDGQCGGFNLQWAYASAQTVARALKNGGQV